MKILAGILLIGTCVHAGEVATLAMKPARGMSRAELHYVKPAGTLRAVLVLCPGQNGDGLEFARDEAWKNFAERERIGLVALSFASPEESEESKDSYYYASKGSGEKLIEGVKKIYGRELPLLLFGISGGAHFTSRFEEWKPKSVLAWCAYTAGWWDIPVRSASNPPGIVACGDEDPRYGASLFYFKQGRAAGKPWIWVSLGNTGHYRSEKLEEFCRTFFQSILKSDARPRIVVDIDSKEKVNAQMEKGYPSLTAIFSDQQIVERWKELHTP